MQAAGQAGPKILFDLSRGKGASGAEIYAAGLETQGAKRRPEALSESDSGGETIQGGKYDSATGNCVGGQNVLQHRVDSVGMFGAELAGAIGPVHAQAEYILTQIDGYGYDNSDLLQGAYVQAGWFLTGETRPYDEKKGVWNRVIPRANFLQGDGWGAFELAGRYDWLNMNTPNINGGALSIGSLGFNWYLTPRIRFMTDYVHVFATNNGQALEATGCSFPAQGRNPNIGCFNGLSPSIWETAVRMDF